MANYFRGSTTKDAVSYSCGEEMIFELELVHDGKIFGVPLFKWECYGDDGAKSSGVVSGETGKVTVKTSVSKPGFAHVIVTACALDGKPLEGVDKFEGGAGAEIDSIQQGVADPEDYDEFWANQLKKLDEIAPEVLMKKEVDSGDPDYAAYDIRLKSLGDVPVSCILTMPKNAAPKSLAAHISFHGYGFDGAIIYRVPGEIRLDVTIHGHENLREKAYYDEYARTHGGFAFNREENKRPETCFFANLILRDIQAVRWLRTLPEYDGKGIIITGGSMGAMQSVNVAAHIDDARSLTINVPWLCDLGGITVGRLRGWRPEFDEGVRYFDTAAAASRVKCPVDISCGLGDYVCPPSGEVVLWHNFKTPKTIKFLQNKTHPYTPIEIISYKR